MFLMRLVPIVLLLASCTVVEADLSSESVAPDCPDEDACVQACLERGHVRAVCGWSWGEPVCVCDASPCDADACYATDPGERVCGVSPDGARREACAE